MQSILLASVLAFGATLPGLTMAYNASAIPIETREQWCQTQVDTCPALCANQDRTTQENECFAENLFSSCVCSDGSRINGTEYSETIPYFTCTLDQGDCINGCGANNDCSEQCKETHKCGATDPKKSNTTASSTSSSASSTASATSGSGSGSGSGFATTGTPAADNAAGGLFLQVGNAYGMGLIAAGVAIGAAFIGL